MQAEDKACAKVQRFERAQSIQRIESFKTTGTKSVSRRTLGAEVKQISRSHKEGGDQTRKTEEMGTREEEKQGDFSRKPRE